MHRAYYILLLLGNEAVPTKIEIPSTLFVDARIITNQTVYSVVHVPTCGIRGCGALLQSDSHSIDRTRADHPAVDEHDLITISFRLPYMICNPKPFSTITPQAIVREGKVYLC